MRFLRDFSESQLCGGSLHLGGVESIATMTVPDWLLHLSPPLSGYPELTVCTSLPTTLQAGTMLASSLALSPMGKTCFHRDWPELG